MSLTINAQVWDFNDGTTQGWIKVNSGATSSLVANGTDITYTFEAKSNVKLKNATANADADGNKFLSITLINNSSVDQLKIHGNNGTDNVYFPFNISPNTSTSKTYVVDLSSVAKWTGTEELVEFLLNENGGVAISAGNIIFDDIRFVAVRPTTERSEYLFDTDGDDEGFSIKSWNGTISVSGGNMTLSPTATKYPKVEQSSYHVNADDYKTMEVRLKNLSTSDNQFSINVANTGVQAIEITTGDTDFKTYKLDLSESPDWVGTELSGFNFRTGATDDASTGTGDIIIDYVKFTSEVLANDELSKAELQISIYPNPASDLLTIESSSKINNVRIFDITGKEVLNTNNTSIDISKLKRGVYALKVSLDNNETNVSRFIKK